MGKEEYFKQRDEIIRTYKEAGRRSEIQGVLKELKKNFETKCLEVPADICWLYGSFLEDYLHDVEICQLPLEREIRNGIILRRMAQGGCCPEKKQKCVWIWKSTGRQWKVSIQLP